MKQLEESFRLNGLLCTLIKRNESIALYGIGGESTDKVLHYEVDIIATRSRFIGMNDPGPASGKISLIPWAADVPGWI